MVVVEEFDFEQTQVTLQRFVGVDATLQPALGQGSFRLERVWIETPRKQVGQAILEERWPKEKKSERLLHLQGASDEIVIEEDDFEMAMWMDKEALHLSTARGPLQLRALGELRSSPFVFQIQRELAAGDPLPIVEQLFPEPLHKKQLITVDHQGWRVKEIDWDESPPVAMCVVPGAMPR